VRHAKQGLYHAAARRSRAETRIIIGKLLARIDWRLWANPRRPVEFVDIADPLVGREPARLPVPSEKIRMFLGICVTICAELILHEKARMVTRLSSITA
jgi:hypothetical protein